VINILYKYTTKKSHRGWLFFLEFFSKLLDGSFEKSSIELLHKEFWDMRGRTVLYKGGRRGKEYPKTGRYCIL